MDRGVFGAMSLTVERLYVSKCTFRRVQWRCRSPCTFAESDQIQSLSSPRAFWKVSSCGGGGWVRQRCHVSYVTGAPAEIGLQLGSRPRWLSWMRRPAGDQEVAGSTPAEVGYILLWTLIMKYFLRSFSPFHWFKKGSCQFLAEECAQYWLTA